MRTAAAAALLLLSGIAATLAVVRVVGTAGEESPRQRGTTVDVRVPAGAAIPPPGAGTVAEEGAPEARSSPDRRRAAPPKPRVPPPPPRVTIPAIDVQARIRPLGLTKEDELQRPPNYTDVGWWSGGAAPGRPGAAVLVGHVDSSTGPAVFYRLRDLRPGDRVLVEDRRGRRFRYRITAREQIRKDRFPTARVYGKTRKRVLRLITCAGPFRASVSSYRDNLILYGTAVDR